MNLTEAREFVTQKRAILETLKDEQEEMSKKRDVLILKSEDIREARELMSQVGIAAQSEICAVIEGLVTQAVQSVYGENYRFEMVNEIKRNKPETTFFIVENGKYRDLQYELGGGLADLVALCLRVVVWAIQSPRTAPVIALDEPLKFLDNERLRYAGEMISKLSEMLGIQFIIITHEDHLLDCADARYHVIKDGDISEVIRLEEGENE